MGINAPLPEGHNCFGNTGSRGFNPYSRPETYPGKGRLRLVEGHEANQTASAETHEIKQPKPAEEAPKTTTIVEESKDWGYSEVEIALRTPPPEYQFRVGDVF